MGKHPTCDRVVITLDKCDDITHSYSSYSYSWAEFVVA